jgi:drug/metabolite transporter (DMT)-like permease
VDWEDAEPLDSTSLIGALLLLARVLALGFERPAFKALARGRDSVAATSLTYLLALVLLLPVLAVVALRGEPLWQGVGQWWPWALASGLVAVVGYNVNMYALGRGEVSLLGMVYSTGLIWLYLSEIALGGARFNWLALAGIFLVIAGQSLLSAVEQPGGLRSFQPLRILREPGALAMLASAILLGVVRLIDKRASAVAPEFGYAFLATVPVVVLSLVLLALQHRSREAVTLLRERPLAAWGSALAHIAGYLILLGAYQYFNASLVEPIGQLSLFVNIAIGALWFHEAVGRRWLPAGLVAAGGALVLLAR